MAKDTDNRNIDWRAVALGLTLAFGMTLLILLAVLRWAFLFTTLPPLPR